MVRTTLGKTLLLLKGCPICSSLGEEPLSAIAKVTRELVLEKGEILAQEGDACTGFYLVLSGRLRVYKSSPNGKERTLLIAEPGMTFGEDALFGAGTYLESAQAAPRARLLRIPRREFLEMLWKSPSLAFQVMESLTLRIRKLSSSVENIAFLGARDNVARYLLELRERSANAAEMMLPGKKKEIAAILGITPETFSRALRALEDVGAIRVDRLRVMILNPSQLSDHA